MEYKLNKIDTDLRRQVNEASKEGKVHGADHKLSVNKDKKQESKSDFQKKLEYKKRILVDAENKEKIDLEAFTDEDVTSISSIGTILDIRK